MIDQIFEKRPKKHVKDLNIVPILDMLTTVIFFLLLSTSFMEYTKVTVPPSASATVSGNDRTPPLSPKMLLVRSGEELRLSLSWAGTDPGESVRSLAQTDPAMLREELIQSSRELVEDFVSSRPSEKTLQIGMGSFVPYQFLISLMDGAREKMPDVVLVSYNEAEARLGREEVSR